jgi:hypothetical protein
MHLDAVLRLRQLHRGGAVAHLHGAARVRAAVQLDELASMRSVLYGKRKGKYRVLLSDGTRGSPTRRAAKEDFDAPRGEGPA